MYLIDSRHNYIKTLVVLNRCVGEIKCNHYCYEVLKASKIQFWDTIVEEDNSFYEPNCPNSKSKKIIFDRKFIFWE